jgi:hypothetical protein
MSSAAWLSFWSLGGIERSGFILNLICSRRFIEARQSCDEFGFEILVWRTARADLFGASKCGSFE